MSGVARAARWAAGALAGLSVRDLAGALAVTLIVVVALCWVLADEDRSWRLAEILGAWRGTRPASRRRAGRDGPRASAASSGQRELPGGGGPGTG